MGAAPFSIHARDVTVRYPNGVVPISSGSLEVGGRRLEALRGRDLRALRGDIGMIFQSFNLAKRASVLDNVLVGRLAHTPAWRTFLGAYRSEDKQIAYEALGWPTAAGRHRPRPLSTAAPRAG